LEDEEGGSDMAHRYSETILIRCAEGLRAEAPGQATDRSANLAGAPAAFLWRGMWYQVDELLATWRLRDRWWVAPLADVIGGADGAEAAPPEGRSDHAARALPADALPATERAYYRVLCRDPQGEQVFDLYYDAATQQWVLDRVHD
jgi:hypothetical protein